MTGAGCCTFLSFAIVFNVMAVDVTIILLSYTAKGFLVALLAPVGVIHGAEHDNVN